MSPLNSIPSGFVVQNFQIDIAEVVDYFSNHDPLFFFVPKYTRGVIEAAVKLSIDDLTSYSPLLENTNLIKQIVQDIELYQSRNPNPFLDNSDNLDQIEIICDQIEEYVDFYVRSKLPANQQCQVLEPRWRGNSLVFGLRIF